MSFQNFGFLFFFSFLLVYLVFREYEDYDNINQPIHAILVRTGTLISRAANWVAVMVIVVGRSCLL